MPIIKFVNNSRYNHAVQILNVLLINILRANTIWIHSTIDLTLDVIYSLVIEKYGMTMDSLMLKY